MRKDYRGWSAGRRGAGRRVTFSLAPTRSTSRFHSTGSMFASSIPAWLSATPASSSFSTCSAERATSWKPLRSPASEGLGYLAIAIGTRWHDVSLPLSQHVRDTSKSEAGCFAAAQQDGRLGGSAGQSEWSPSEALGHTAWVLGCHRAGYVATRHGICTNHRCAEP